MLSRTVENEKGSVLELVARGGKNGKRERSNSRFELDIDGRWKVLSENDASREALSFVRSVGERASNDSAN